ncbi:hypothetical protein [Microbispora sp. H13382]|uniref:hypothetical protein n=1 Tax=Microbispora sp. H13382 TaxID=2729112 RepID=UPI00160281CC|nr:hypothetical protein [Microbispora sp. H13382]
MSDVVMSFARTGKLRSIGIGMRFDEVIALLGPADGSTGGDDAIYAFEDLQLGFSANRMLWLIQVEPRGEVLVLPTVLGGEMIRKTTDRSSFLQDLRSDGYDVERCEPFAKGELWWKVLRSGVLVRFGDNGLLETMQLARRSVATTRCG